MRGKTRLRFLWKQVLSVAASAAIVLILLPNEALASTTGQTFSKMAQEGASMPSATSAAATESDGSSATGSAASQGQASSSSSEGAKAAPESVSISDTTGTGTSLKAILSGSADTDSDGSISYQWLSCKSAEGTYAPIEEATSSELDTADLAGMYVKVEVTTDTGTVTSAAFGPIISSEAQSEEAGTQKSSAATEAGTSKASTSEVQLADAQSGANAEASVEARISVAVIAPDSTGGYTYWMQPSYLESTDGDTAMSASVRAFEAAGLTADVQSTDYGLFLNSITSASGETLSTGYVAPYHYWELIVDGGVSEIGAGEYIPHDGDEIVWKYTCYGDADTTVTQVEYDNPKDQLENYAAEWPEAEAGGNVTSAATPTEGCSESWRLLVGGGVSTSEPLIVGGKVYIAVGDQFMGGTVSSTYTNRLVRIDKESGEVEATGQLAGTLNVTLTSRPIYSGGIVYVALDDGLVQAFDAKTMKTRWVSSTTTDADQSTGALRIVDGVLYVGTSAGSTGPGALRALDASSGKTLWTFASSSGYNWTSPVVVGSCLYIGDTAGTVHVLDAASGKELSSISLCGYAINSDPVASEDGSWLYVATKDGTLYKLAIVADGSLQEAASVKALSYCVSAPTVIGSTAVIGGTNALSGKGASLAVVDLDSMSIICTVTRDDKNTISSSSGSISSPVLVSQSSAAIWCYFTVNDAKRAADGSYLYGGGLYVWRLGDSVAHLLYLPTSNAEYCDYPVICDADGFLYYINDSGYLVRLGRGASPSSSSSSSSPSATSSPSAAFSVATATRSDRLTSGLQAKQQQRQQLSATTQEEPLLSGFASDSQQENPEKASPDAAAEKDASGMPLWPIVGLGAGVIVILIALLRQHHKRI